ncbi:MAG TPA: DUF2147 domain-containing protein [Bryobacteraceae bacterium]|jgi:uncharacterized protein (DUF2147 family)|nr:DUF2147 domain-containing protein [Bryobacteraceae bacterium]
MLRVAMLLCWCASILAAQAPARTTPVGRWKTVSDVNGKATSIISIWEENGKLYGRIEKLLNPNPRDPNPRCTACAGELKDQPVVGLRFMWDLHKDGSQWSGGRILDPDSGKAYRCLMALEDAGKKLKVRGFIGVSMLGRTQYWYPED